MDGTNRSDEAAGGARANRRVRVRHIMRSNEAIAKEEADAETRAQLKRRAADRVREDGTVEPVAYSKEQYDAAFAEARQTIEDQIATTRKRQGAMRYLSVFGLVAAIGVTALYQLNGRFAQELYDKAYSHKIAEAFDNGDNFGVFDLNIDIRNLRDAHLKRLDETPDVVLLGASHWQEADVDLVTDRTMYNAHIHRDYYEDPLAMIEMLERHDRLPDTLILTIRDNQFTPVAQRTDFLWLPGIPYYRRMAKQLGIKAHHPVEVAPVDTWRNRLNLDILHTNVKRWLEADVKPGPTTAEKLPTLDILLPGGSIVWSEEHDRFFTQERMRKESLDFAASKRNNPPQIDPRGVEHIDRLLTYLDDKGVRVYLAHPPFNPVYWEAVQGSPYMEGLKKIEKLTQDWADRFGWEVVGGFNPASVGCRADQYIDAEHSNRECLRGIFDQFVKLDREYHGLPPLDEVDPATLDDEPNVARTDAAPSPIARPAGVAAAAPAAGPAPKRGQKARVVGGETLPQVPLAAAGQATEAEPVETVAFIDADEPMEPVAPLDPQVASTRSESISSVARGAGLKTNEALALIMNSELRGDLR